MAKVLKSEKVPEPIQATFDAVVALTDEFCREHLTEEYRQLARQVAATLCRKRPAPLARGDLNTWACGIIYALGFVNFLFDRSQNPSMGGAELCARFGISKSTGAAKAKAVRDLLKMGQLDPHWCLPSKLEDNPLAWMIRFNGIVMDARQMPLAIQEIAYKKGLIPYVPSKKEGGSG